MTLIYKGNLFAKSNRILRSDQTVQNNAQYKTAQGLSGATGYDWIEEQIYSCHVGDLFNVKEDWLNPDELRPKQLWTERHLRKSLILNAWREVRFPGQDWDDITFEMRELFGVCPKSTFNKFLKFAEHPPTRQIDEHLVPRMMFIDFAVRIHSGAIAQSAEREEAELAR